MKKLILFMILCISLSGCVKYHSKSSDAPKVSKNNVPVNEVTNVEDTSVESPFIDYDYGDFEEIDEDDNVKNVYHVKVARILL